MFATLKGLYGHSLVPRHYYSSHMNHNSTLQARAKRLSLSSFMLLALCISIDGDIAALYCLQLATWCLCTIQLVPSLCLVCR